MSDFNTKNNYYINDANKDGNLNNNLNSKSPIIYSKKIYA